MSLKLHFVPQNITAPTHCNSLVITGCFLCRSTHYSSRPAKRLWHYLVNCDYLHDVFIHYVFRKRKTLSEVSRFIASERLLMFSSYCWKASRPEWLCWTEMKIREICSLKQPTGRQMLVTVDLIFSLDVQVSFKYIISQTSQKSWFSFAGAWKWSWVCSV